MNCLARRRLASVRGPTKKQDTKIAQIGDWGPFLAAPLSAATTGRWRQTPLDHPCPTSPQLIWRTMESARRPPDPGVQHRDGDSAPLTGSRLCLHARHCQVIPARAHGGFSSIADHGQGQLNSTAPERQWNFPSHFFLTRIPARIRS
jgi:hypothetical protein